MSYRNRRTGGGASKTTVTTTTTTTTVTRTRGRGGETKETRSTRETKSTSNAPKGYKTYGLLIDSKPGSGNDNVMQLAPSEMSKSGVLNPSKFTSCIIRNTNADDIRPSALLGIFTALQPGASCEIILANPILVMQPYEAKMVMANAKLAGFEGIESHEEEAFNDDAQRNLDITVITMTKPNRN